MKANRSNAGWGFWGKWVLASAVGGVIGLFGLGERLIIYATGEQASSSFLVLGLSAGIVSGVALAAIGYAFLRRDVSWVWWCLGSFAVSIIGWTALGAVSQSIAAGNVTISSPVIAAIKGIWFGGCIGISQWLVLTRKVSGAGWWIIANIAGWSLLLAVGYPVMNAGLIGHIDIAVEVITTSDLGISGRDIIILSQAGFAVFGGIAFGAQLGLMQWLVLRRNIGQVQWWPLVSAFGWALAWLLAGLVYKVVFPTAMRFEFYGALVFFGLFVGLGGATTGIPLVWLLRRPIKTEHVPRIQTPVAWWMGVGIVVAITALALGVALATVDNKPEERTPTEDCYSVRSDKDSLDILSFDPPEGTTFQSGAVVGLTINCKYNLESHKSALLQLRWTDNVHGGLLAESEVSGSGQMILEGILLVPDSKEVFITLHLSPPPEIVLQAGFTCSLNIVDVTIVYYSIQEVR